MLNDKRRPSNFQSHILIEVFHRKINEHIHIITNTENLNDALLRENSVFYTFQSKRTLIRLPSASDQSQNDIFASSSKKNFSKIKSQVQPVFTIEKNCFCWRTYTWYKIQNEDKHCVVQNFYLFNDILESELYSGIILSIRYISFDQLYLVFLLRSKRILRHRSSMLQ